MFLIGSFFCSLDLWAGSSIEKKDFTLIDAAMTLCLFSKLDTSKPISDREMTRRFNDEYRRSYGNDTGLKIGDKKIYSCIFCGHTDRADEFIFHVRRAHCEKLD